MYIVITDFKFQLDLAAFSVVNFVITCNDADI